MEQRIEAKFHLDNARNWCTAFYLMNQKQLIQAIKCEYFAPPIPRDKSTDKKLYKKEQDVYAALLGIVEPNGKITWITFRLKDDWFEQQALPGSKEEVKRGSQNDHCIILDQAESHRTDQVKKMRYKGKRSNVKDGIFIGLTEDGNEIEFTYDEMMEHFKTATINQILEKSKLSRRNYYLLPPGDVKDKENSNLISFNYPRIAFNQRGKQICIWPSMASALYSIGLIKHACILYSKAWTTTRHESVWFEFYN